MELVRLINAVYDQSRGDNPEQALKSSIASMISYTKTHFSMEEDLMKKHVYPRAVEHKLEHTKVIATVQEFNRIVNSGIVDRKVVTEHMSFLKTWLFDHIMKVDKDFGKFLKTKNVQ